MAKKKTINLDQFFTSPAPEADDLAFLLGAEPEATAQRAAERGLPLKYVATTAIAPDPQQLRHLPHPAELQRAALDGNRAAAAILAGLEELGRSMREHGQIQPVVVYADQDVQQPEITHRLLNGHRRWSAAILFELPQLWVVEVERPTEVFRLRQQFEENERREDFTDMERAWALLALKDALQAETGETIPWGVIEKQLQLSVQRRQDLLRLLRFSPEAQQLVMSYGWSEWTLRPLHMAINAGDLSQQEATDMLHILADRDDVNATTVDSLLKSYRYARVHGSDTTQAAENPKAQSARHNDREVVFQHVSRLRRGVQQLQSRIAQVQDKAARAEFRADLVQLRDHIQDVLDELD